MPGTATKYGEDVRDRLNIVLNKLYGGTNADFARDAKIQEPTLHKVLSGVTKNVSNNIVEKVIENIADDRGRRLRREWLLDGEGAMLLSGQGDGGNGYLPEVEGVDAATLSGRQMDALGLCRVENTNVRVSAGPGSEVHFEEAEGYTLFEKSYIRQQYGVRPERLKRITIVGTSMKPTLEPGEKAIVVLLNGDEKPMDGAIYVIHGPTGLQIKRLYFDVETKEIDGEEVTSYYVRIWSDNPEEGRHRVPLEVFEQDYRLIASFRKTEKSL